MCTQSKCECLSKHAKALAKLKVGDKVNLPRIIPSYDGGWGFPWSRFMDLYVGRTGTIVSMNEDLGVGLDFAPAFYFPAHGLVLVQEHSKAEAVKPHVHAASMKLYAEDAAETDKPWERWEVKAEYGSWQSFDQHPHWTPTQQYRRKRKMRYVNGFSVPAPKTQAPSHGTKIFVPYITSGMWYFESKWDNDKLHPELLRRGLVFLNKEDAIANAKAMCGIDPSS